jgi:hypothetical protein
MNIINAAKPTVRLFAAMLVTVTVIGLSTLAMHAPTQTQNAVTLKSIQTDRAATFYANSRSPDCAWFVELVLPTDGKLAASGPSPTCAWFVELVLPTGDSKLMAENLQSVAATL